MFVVSDPRPGDVVRVMPRIYSRSLTLEVRRGYRGTGPLLVSVQSVSFQLAGDYIDTVAMYFYSIGYGVILDRLAASYLEPFLPLVSH